jgi:ParB family transcriptional regulator, chromosome partitioning protein
MHLEFHQLDRRWEHGRARCPDRQKRLLASLAANDQQIPIVVVAVSGQPDRYLVIDGFQRIQALEQLGRDTVEAVVWPSSELEAVLLEHAMRTSRRMTALEEGWLLEELERLFGYGAEDLARRFDRSPGWVSRRLALVGLLPPEVQQRVRTGEITAHLAMKFLYLLNDSGIVEGRTEVGGRDETAALKHFWLFLFDFSGQIAPVVLR